MSFEKIKRIATNNQYEFVYKKKCKSTMLALKELYNIKNKNYIIIADEQTNGVGRRGSIWHSPKGNIYCSMNFNGQIKIKELRSLAENELGSSFDLKYFHDIILNLSSVPLYLLEKQIDDWIKITKL